MRNSCLRPKRKTFSTRRYKAFWSSWMSRGVILWLEGKKLLVEFQLGSSAKSNVRPPTKLAQSRSHIMINSKRKPHSQQSWSMAAWEHTKILKNMKTLTETQSRPKSKYSRVASSTKKETAWSSHRASSKTGSPNSSCRKRFNCCSPNTRSCRKYEGWKWEYTRWAPDHSTE